LNSLTSGYDELNDDATARYNTLARDTSNLYGNERQGTWDKYKDYYDTVYDQYQDREDTAMSMLNGLGDQEKKDLEQNWKEQQAAGTQNMISSGLTGTTIMPTMNMGYEREKNADLSRLNERLQEQKLDTYGTYSGDKLSASNAVKNSQIATDTDWASQLASTLTDIGSNKTSTLNTLDENALTSTTNFNTSSTNKLLDLKDDAKDDYAAVQQALADWIYKKEEPYNDVTPYLNMITGSTSNLANAYSNQQMADAYSSQNNWWGQAFGGAAQGFGQFAGAYWG
jgi:hypothetical protein